MRRNGTAPAVRGLAAAVLTVAVIMACSDGGPTGVVGFNVAGGWVEISTLISDECDTNIPETTTTPVTIIYNGGTQITFLFHFNTGDVALIGNFNTQTHDFALPFGAEDPVSGDSVVGLQSGTFTSESSYTSSTQVTLTVDGVSCTVRTSEAAQKV